MDHRTRLIVSLVFKLLAAVLAAGAFLGFSVAIGHDGSFVFKALCGTAGAFCGVLASYAYIYSKRLVALSASELRKTDPRPPVFYLRAFQDDWKTADLRQTDIPVFHSISTEQEHFPFRPNRSIWNGPCAEWGRSWRRRRHEKSFPIWASAASPWMTDGKKTS